ncbi:MAG TPA: hypothetical protein VIJ26_18775, partial [Thermoanaerobaculia bacterium]
MRFRSLAAFPLLYAVLFIVIAAIAWSLQGGVALASFTFSQRILVRVLATVGCFAAVSCFERGDHLRSAWLWLGGGTIVILIRDLLRLFPGFAPQGGDPKAQIVVTALGILSNLALLAGIWMLSRSWKMAAITLPGGRSGFGVVAVATAVIALTVTGPGAYTHLQELARGDWSSLVLVVSAVVDIITLCLITPLLLTAISLRGSLFAWPWGLLTASQLAWLLYDIAASLRPGLLPAGLPLSEVFRGLAENYLFA